MLLYLDFLAVIAALRVPISVRNKWYKSYMVVINTYKMNDYLQCE